MDRRSVYQSRQSKTEKYSSLKDAKFDNAYHLSSIFPIIVPPSVSVFLSNFFQVATEMDGAKFGAWSNQTNLENYDPNELRRLQFE